MKYLEWFYCRLYFASYESVRLVYVGFVSLFSWLKRVLHLGGEQGFAANGVTQAYGRKRRRVIDPRLGYFCWRCIDCQLIGFTMALMCAVMNYAAVLLSFKPLFEYGKLAFVAVTGVVCYGLHELLLFWNDKYLRYFRKFQKSSLGVNLCWIAVFYLCIALACLLFLASVRFAFMK